MNDDRIEYLINQVYYNYLNKEEADELINYITILEKENLQLKINCDIGNDNLNFYREEYKKYKSILEEIKECLEKEYSFAKKHDIPLMSKAEQLAGKLFEILNKVQQ